MAESSSLLIAPSRNWFGRCFTTRLFRGLGVGVGSGVDVGAGSGVGAVETGSKFGVDVGPVATVLVEVDRIGCATKVILSRPYIDRKITIIDRKITIIKVTAINFRFSIRIRLCLSPRHMQRRPRLTGGPFPFLIDGYNFLERALKQALR